MSSITLFVVLLQAVSLLAYPSQLTFKVGDQHAYSLNAFLDARGKMTTNNQRSSGVLSSMKATVVIKCTDKDADSFLFVMNMWDTTVSVGQGTSLTETQFEQLGDWLGPDMYFQQKQTGEIVKVWYRTDDDPYLVQVKLGAINAFQTRIVPPKSLQQFQESDPVGVHVSNFLGVERPSILEIQKNFTQKDFHSFPDPKLHQNNVNIQALTTTHVHPAGFVQASSVVQFVDIINMAQAPKMMQSTKRATNLQDADTSAMDFYYSSFGNLSIGLNTKLQLSTPLKTMLTMSQLDSEDMSSGNMHDIASLLVLHVENDVDVDTLKTQMFADDLGRSHKAMDKLIRHYRKNPSDFLNNIHLHDLSDAATRHRVLYVLSGIAETSDHAISALVELMKNGPNKLSAIYSANNIQKPKDVLIELLYNDVISMTDDSTVKHAALLVFGALIGKSESSHWKQTGREVLLDMLSSNSREDVVIAIHAIGNAGPSVFDATDIPNDIVKNEDSSIRVAVAQAMRKFLEVSDPSAIGNLVRMRRDSSFKVRNVANDLLGSQEVVGLSDSDFPFNKSYSTGFKLGGSVVNINFKGELFAGTNFNCNQQYFNYEALARATADASLFKWTKNAFLAEAIYGKANGVVVGNQVLLRVWNDVIYQKSIPTVDCKEHIYDIAHTSPGFSVSYTLWISVIPVVFSANAKLALDLKWGWQVCDSQLSALVELIPTATLTVGGDAEINLLIIKAGVELSGSFNTQVKPQGYIHGSQCTVGFDLVQQNNPMTIDFTAYYAYKKCKFLIFDCKWGNHNQKTIFHWSLPSKTNTLYKKEWKIAG